MVALPSTPPCMDPHHMQRLEHVRGVLKLSVAHYHQNHFRNFCFVLVVVVVVVVVVVFGRVLGVFPQRNLPCWAVGLVFHSYVLPRPRTLQMPSFSGILCGPGAYLNAMANQQKSPRKNQELVKGWLGGGSVPCTGLKPSHAPPCYLEGFRHGTPHDS